MIRSYCFSPRIFLLVTCLVVSPIVFSDKNTGADGGAYSEKVQFVKNQGADQTIPAQIVIEGGLALEKAGEAGVYFSYQGVPVLSVGGGSDRIFWHDIDTFNYKRWADWAEITGVNHLRAYPPFSWKFTEQSTFEEKGNLNKVEHPFVQVSEHQFDLSKFNGRYWSRFREQCEYLRSKGIIIHLLIFNSWSLNEYDDGAPDSLRWGSNFFNPINNINVETNHLDQSVKFYSSVADNRKGLVELQKAWIEKLIDETYDLGNVYYDLSHEMGDDKYETFPKAKEWIVEMASHARSYWEEKHTSNTFILGMDTGGFKDSERDWVFSRDFFDVLIYGKQHSIQTAYEWRAKYNKPYIPQEAWSVETNEKYSYRVPEQRVEMRKYLWRFMMSKVQQLDVYYRERLAHGRKNPPGSYMNYDPRGWNSGAEIDFKYLRAFWDLLNDYPNLLIKGKVLFGPWDYKMVLSSSSEAVVYLSFSAAINEEKKSTAQPVKIFNLALNDGNYKIIYYKPDLGIIQTRLINIEGGRFEFILPDFKNDMAVLIQAVEK